MNLTNKIELTANSTLLVFDKLITSPYSNNIMEHLIDTLPWTQDKYNFNGIDVLSPRLIDYQGVVNYRFSGNNHYARPFDTVIKLILNIVKAEASEYFDADALNGVVINYYRDGNDSISQHTDAESCINLNTPIVGISFGVERIMEFRNVFTKEKFKLPLTDGGCFVMVGKDFQKEFTHGIAKDKSVVKPRVSLTFRRFYF